MSADAEALVDLVGTLRTCTPDRTLAWIRPMFPEFGLTRVARVTGLDHIGIHVSVAVRPMSLSLTVSQGKGLTAELADVSAAMESIELWHAEHLEAPAVEATYTHLAVNHQVIDPAELPRGPYSRTVDLHDTPTGWYLGHDLVSGADVLVPGYAIDMRADAPRAEWATAFCTTNGLASGNTRDEAICHALFEVIERDAVARLELDSAEARQAELNLDSVDGPARPILEQLERARVRVRVWDVTSAAGVPTFACWLRGDSELRGLTTFIGQGTHLSKDVALLRALTEAAQSRLTLISGSRDDQDSAHYADMRRTADEDLPPRPPRAGKPYASVVSPNIPRSFSEIAADLANRVGRLGAKHAVVVDLMKPGLGVPVVSLHVPGLRHHPH